MPRTFAYLHVSTIGQPTDNQLQEIGAAGFKVELRRVAGVHLIQRSEDSRGCDQADLPSLRRAAVKLRALGGWRRELSTKVSRHEPDMRGHGASPMETKCSLMSKKPRAGQGPPCTSSPMPTTSS